MFYKMRYLLIIIFVIQLNAQEGEYVSIENFMYRHELMKSNINDVLVTPVDRFLNNRIIFFIEEQFEGKIESSRNVIWESYSTTINPTLRSHSITFTVRVYINKNKEFRYIEIDYLPSSDEISTRYKWSTEFKSFVLKEDEINIQKFQPDLVTLGIKNQPQKATLDQLIIEHKSFSDGMLQNTIYFNRSRQDELMFIYGEIGTFIKNGYPKSDFIMNIVWDSYYTFVSNYDVYHYHSFVVQMQLNDLDRPRFLEVYYNPSTKKITSDFKWNEKAQEYLRISKIPKNN